ncbi:MAG TPA: oligosaccharide flippase family protein [Pyrinomonadaceae bacterium]|nr:oligosaccharide flippase family protein [Pyrinomonadaceae bacterium]
MSKTAPQTSAGVARNAVYGALTWVLPLLLSLAATPIIVRALGIETYGIYALVLGLVGYSFNFGIGRAATKYIAEYRIDNEFEKINSVVSATLFLSVGFGLAGVILLALLARPLVDDVLLIEAGSREQAVTAIYIASLIVLVTSINQVFGSIIQGLQRFDVYSKLFNANSFALLIGNMVLALMGFGLSGLLTWNLVTLTLSTLAFAILAKRLLPELHIGIAGARVSLRLVSVYSLGIVGYQVLANSLLLFERGWITRVLGSESLTYYAVAMSIGVYIQGFSASLTLLLSPLTSETERNSSRMASIYQRATRLVSVFVLFMSLMVIVGAEQFLTLWLGADFAARAELLLILHTITFAFVSVTGVSWMMREGLGVPSHNFYIFIACFVVAMALMITLVEPYGSTGVAVARLVGFSLMFLSIRFFEAWLFGSMLTDFWLRLLAHLGIAGAAAAVGQWAVLNYLSLSWPVFVLSVAFAGVIYVAMLLALGFLSSDEKLLIRRMVLRRSSDDY